MNFREYARKRLDLEKQISQTYEDEMEQQAEIQKGLDDAFAQVRALNAKSDIIKGGAEGKRRQLREDIRNLDLEFTEHGND